MDDVIGTKGFYDNKEAQKVINEVPPITNFKESGVLNFASFLRSSRTPVILKVNEHGYDSITVLQYWKTIPTAKQNKMNCILMRNVTLPSWY